MDIYRNENYIVIRHNNTPIDGELNQPMTPVFYPKVDTEEYEKHEDNCKAFEYDTGCYLTTACMKYLKETFDDIKAMNYESAYSRYKNMVLTLEEQFAHPVLEQRLLKSIKINIRNV